MIALTYFQAASLIVVILWIGVAVGVFTSALGEMSSRNFCTGDCNQGRNCTCRGSCDA